ncbi:MULTISPECIES: VanZ family protein [Bacillus]|uniref:VanZ family protein n=1 Tax=Bacillus TaxID=1386 RepID=UPI000BB7DB56|nr:MULTISPECIES: VanZ family protein [Bacillus]
MKIHIKWLRAFSWLLVVAWMFLIFFLSAQPAEQSSQLSGGITDAVIETVEKVLPNVSINRDTVSHLIRKNAHFLAYLILGVLVTNALYQSSKLRGKQQIVLAFIICVLYAISDEVHQLFVPGRSGEIRDVIIDSAGAAVGIFTFHLLILLGRKPLRKSKTNTQ